jgi:spore maturation protein CgeB
MRFVMFYHSLVSDWNHGNAHFLRGVVSELLARGHSVEVYEPADGWSLTHLKADHGDAAVEAFYRAYPDLRSRFYDPQQWEVERVLEGADVVIVHEWNDPDLVGRIGRHRARHGDYRLLFHDTHHRSVTDPQAIARYDLRHYDGVLAFGRIIRDLYLTHGWAARAWTWHEAADARLFYPRPTPAERLDLVWIGNWGDDERVQELHEYLLTPVRCLRLRAACYGVRYPEEGRQGLAQAGIHYAGWLPNFQVPEVFAGYRATVHVPRRPYRTQLAGIPTIRVFEALACGIPLVTAPWDDSEGLFTPGKDYLVARDGLEMESHLNDIVHDRCLAAALAEQGRRTILARHTCGHRVDELLAICRPWEGAPA